jgi:hypothetical protein
MKTLLMILIILPHILLAGWIKEGNGYISQDSLPGQKRFLPAENALIVENKDFVLKYDLTTGEIIKRIDIDESDSTYKMAVANDDLSQVYILTENFFRNPNNSSVYYFIVLIKDYNTQKILHLDTNLVTYENYYYSVNLESNLFYFKNRIFYSLKNGTTTYLGWTHESVLRIYSAVSRDTLQMIATTAGTIDSYSLLNPFNSLSYFSNYKSEIRTKGLEYQKYTNDLLNYNDNSNSIKTSFTSNESTSISNIVNGKTTNYCIYGYGGKLILKGSNGKETKNLKYGLNTPISFTKNDNYFFVVYPFFDLPYQNAISIQTLDGEVIFRDTIPTNIPREIVFDDGKTFYFSINDRLFKYSPEFLNPKLLKAKINDIRDSVFKGEEFSLYSISMGLPTEEKWYLDDILISEARKFNYSISSIGQHTIKLVVKNDELADSAVKFIFVESLNSEDDKLLDFEIEVLSKNPLIAKFKVISESNFKEYSWNFGNGVSITGKNLSYKYNDTGTYSISLTAMREDGTYEQEIKFDVLSSNENDIDYSKPLFERFELRGENKLYFKTLLTFRNINLIAKDKLGNVLMEEYFDVLPKGKIFNIIKPIDNEYRIIIKNSDGVEYEY